ncbi:MAG: FtsX-like permease family protein, partial [Gemmatimonadetes bacterium]|nr:FtsX-like permease family protein [Gemmatimonadota bacterium]
MKPPRAARWILRAFVPAEEADDVLENLEQLYLAKRSERGRLPADLWFWRQAVLFPLTLGASSGLSDLRRHGLGQWLRSAAADLRFGLRTFRTAPAFVAGVVLTLALGLGANVAVFAVVHSVLLRPLPYPDAEELKWIWPEGTVAPTHERFEELDQVASGQALDLTAFAVRSFSVQGGAEARIVPGAAVATDFIETVALGPQLGRSFRESDGFPGAERVALISDDLWRTQFGADSSLIGQTVDVHTAASIPMIPGAFTGARHTVVGILPPSYEPFGYDADVVTPLVRDPGDLHFSNMGELVLLARSRLDVEAIRRELANAARGLPSFNRLLEQIEQSSVVTLREALFGSLRPTLLLTLAAVAVVLLIACVNVANLTLTRSRKRRQELAVRMALGAGKGRVIRQLLTESLLLSTAAGTLGLLGAGMLLGPLLRLVPTGFVSTAGVRLDGPVLVFTALLVLATGLTAGVTPALTAGRRALEREGRSGSRAAARHTMGRGLAATQVALALVLAQAAVLLVLSFDRLQRVDPGLRPEGVVTLRVSPSEQRYEAVEERRALVDRALEGARALPGVSSAGAIHFLPIADGGPGINFLLDPSDPESTTSAGYRVVTPGYVESMGIPVRQGRSFDPDDVAGSAPVGMVNERLASLLWPGEEALGRTVYRTSGTPFFTVVGVTGDVRQRGVQAEPQPEIYIPLAQSAWASEMSLVVRTTKASSEIHPELRRVVRELDANLPITRMSTMTDVVEQSLSTPRFLGLLFAAFAGLALTLGGVGIYGVVSTVVADRTDEIGIRMALGA